MTISPGVGDPSVGAGGIPAADERVRSVRVNDETLSVELMDGRTISVPLAWFSTLMRATPEQRSNWRIVGAGYGIHWPDLDEDLSTYGLLAAHEGSGRSRGLVEPTLPAIPRFDPSFLAGTFQKPRFDVETMATAQRRNVEAMTAVCQLAFDCVQQSAQRQTQLFRDTAEEMLGSFRRVGRLDDPEEQANAQLAAGRHALERGMASLRELAELIARTNAEALEIIKQRASGFNEGLDVSKRDAGKGTNQP